MVGFIPSPVNLETILIRREVQARKAAKALATYVPAAGHPSLHTRLLWPFSQQGKHTGVAHAINYGSI